QEVSSEPVAKTQRPLQVDSVARDEFAQVGAAQSLRNRLKSALVANPFDDRQASAVDRHAVADHQLRAERLSGDGQLTPRTVGLNVTYGTHGFNKTCKH